MYESIADGQSRVLQLQLVAEGRLIGFYRLDTGEKLLIPDELAAALQKETQARQHEAQARQQEAQARQQAEERAAELEAQLARYRAQFGELPDS